MVAVGRGLTAVLALLLAVLCVLGLTTGLGTTGWAAGLAAWSVAAGAVASSRPAALGPADLVTLVRLTLACAVAALVVESLAGPESSRSAVVALTAVALLLDAVDGQVARRTRSASEFGARFDGEADAFLLLVLSAYVALELAPWAILIGAARYLFAAAGWPWPWLRGRLPRRDWRKVVTATQGIVLLVAASGLLPDRPVRVALLAALALLAESFGRDVWWLWRRRPTATAGAPRASAGRRVRP